jgi:predicted ATPase/class 3 adenylate cyclase
VSELLPTGTVTLLLADVEGSTHLWETKPDVMTIAFALLDRTLGELLAAHDGVRPVEQGEGDSFVLAFRRASDAVACALNLQHAPLSPIRLRIGVHTGEVQLRDEGNYIGPTINKTARIRDLGHGGQILISGATEEMVVDGLPLDVWLVDLGTHQLRGVVRPERILQVCHADFRNEFPPLRTTNSFVAQRLPAQITSFVGRGEEIKHVLRLVAEHRMVTLTGAGGAGKTRLALEIAGQLVDEYRDGVWFVNLAPVTDAENVTPTVSRALGLPDQSSASTLDTITRFIGERRMLVLLDNCEHLVDASAALAAALLTACGGLNILTTSREPVGVTGEVTWRVPSLSLADEAIALFADRARHVRPDLRLSESDRHIVIEICRRLDGMPLAIELAAARIRAMSLTEIAGSLHDRFHLLTGGARTLMARQQTLRASVDWSHDLLSDTDRVLFRRLAVFVGGFDLDAAHAVALAGYGQAHEMLDEITSLVDKSLIVAEGRHGRTRYRMLETVRQYAAEKLIDAGENDTVRTRHRDYYMAYYHAKVDDLHRLTRAGRPQLLGQHRFTETDNMRAAFAWSVSLEPDEDMLTKAASGAAWLLDLAMADRLSDAAIRAGGGVGATFTRAYVLSFLGRGHEADALLADALGTRLDDKDIDRLIFLQAINRLFALADPEAAKSLIDDIARPPGPKVRDCIDAFLVVYHAAMGHAALVNELARGLRDRRLPDVAGRAAAWAITLSAGDAGRTSDAVDAAESGYPIPARGYFVITPTLVHCFWPDKSRTPKMLQRSSAYERPTSPVRKWIPFSPRCGVEPPWALEDCRRLGISSKQPA